MVIGIIPFDSRGAGALKWNTNPFMTDHLVNDPI
jgi:hypothetical protein